MQVDLYMKYKLFADDINDATRSVKMDKPGPQPLLDKVVVNEQGVFTFDEVLRVYTESGKEPDEKKVRNVLSQWKSRGYIEDFENGTYRRITDK